MKKVLVVSGLFVMLLSTGVSQAEAQVRININAYPPGYMYPGRPYYGYNANPYYNQRYYGGGGCGNGNFYNRGNGYYNGYYNGYGGGRGRHGHGHHGCR